MKREGHDQGAICAALGVTAGDVARVCSIPGMAKMQNANTEESLRKSLTKGDSGMRSIIMNALNRKDRHAIKVLCQHYGVDEQGLAAKVVSL
jgi:hypothetical protein